jgi:hypothetical protein
VSRLAFAAWFMLAWDLGRLAQYLTDGDAARIAGGAVLTAVAFVVAYGAPAVRRRRLLRSLRPPKVHPGKTQ